MRKWISLWILLVLAVVSVPVHAHAPSDMTLAYNSDSQTLRVTLVHNVADPFTHYVYRIEIKKNGTVYTVEEFENQPTDSQFQYSFSVSAVRGDTLEVTAECNRGGSLAGEVTVDGTEEVKAPQVWPIHAVFMSVGLVLMVIAVINVLNKTPESWWFKAHKILGGLAIGCVVIGFVTAVYMVSVSGGSHFRVSHAYIGILTILFSVITPLVGTVSVKWKGHKPQMRNVHIWCGRITVVLIVVTILSGLLQAGII